MRDLRKLFTILLVMSIKFYVSAEEPVKLDKRQDLVVVQGHLDDDSSRDMYPFFKKKLGLSYTDSPDAFRLRSVAWHPTDPTLFAIAGGPMDSHTEILLVRVAVDRGITFFSNVSSLRIGGGYQINSIAWHSNGKYILVGGSGGSADQIRVLEYDPTKKTLSTLVTASWGGAVYGVDWHPTGLYFAVGGSGQTKGYEVIVYALDETTPALVAATQVDLAPSGIAYSVAWNEVGDTLAVGCDGGANKQSVRLFKFTSGCLFAAHKLTAQGTYDFGGTQAYVKSLSWSPDGKYLAAGGYSVDHDKQVRVFFVDNGILTNLHAASVNFGMSKYGAVINAVAWDPEQKYLLIGGAGTGEGVEFGLMTFKNEKLYPKLGAQINFGNNVATIINTVAWQPARQYALVGGYQPSNGEQAWLMEMI